MSQLRSGIVMACLLVAFLPASSEAGESTVVHVQGTLLLPDQYYLDIVLLELERGSKGQMTIVEAGGHRQFHVRGETGEFTFEFDVDSAAEGYQFTISAVDKKGEPLVGTYLIDHPKLQKRWDEAPIPLEGNSVALRLPLKWVPGSKKTKKGQTAPDTNSLQLFRTGDSYGLAFMYWPDVRQ